MNQKKNTKIIVILIIMVLVLILVTAGTFIYFKTDLLKNNKQLFFKYTMKIADKEKGFIENSLNAYLKNKKENSYTDEGIISFNITSETEQAKYKDFNNFNITFTGQVDKKNNKNQQEINLNYSDTIKFPIKYKKVNDVIGLQTEFVGNKYIASKSEEAENLLADGNQETNINISLIDKISQIQFTEEEKKHIKDRYFNIVYNNLTNEQFSKLQEANSEAYKLTLKGSEVKNIANKVFETLKYDQITLGKIEEICGMKASDIEKQVQDLNSNEKINEEIFVITIYNQNGNVSKIIFETSEYKILIEKILYGNQLNYTLTIEFIEENIKNILKGSFEGIQSNQNVKENYEIEILKNSKTYKYAYRSSINFNNNIKIEEFNEENSIILSNYNIEQIGSFIIAVKDRIEQVNKQQMEQLNYEKNPLSYILAPFVPEQEEISTEIKEMEINTFNSKFELYTSNGLKGVTVKGLISTISLNNETMNEDRKIKEINFNGEEYEATETNLETIKNNIDKEAEYRIEFEKIPETGLIYRAIINLK